MITNWIRDYFIFALGMLSGATLYFLVDLGRNYIYSKKQKDEKRA